MRSTSHTTTAQSVPLPTGSFLERDAIAVLQDLRSAIASTLAATGVPIKQPRDVKLAFGVHQTLAWKVHRFATGANVLADARFLPGAQGIATFAAAAKLQGVPSELVARMQSSFDRFQTLVQSQSGDRSSLELMLAGLTDTSEAPAPNNRSVRRSGFKCASAVWGVQMRQKLLCQIIAPSDNADLLDFVVIRGSIGMRRLRRGTKLPIAPISLLDAEGEAPARTAIRALDPSSVRNGLAILPQFCSDPVPEICIGKNPRGIPEYQLADAPLGGKEGATVVSAELYRAAGSRYKDSTSQYGNTALSVRQPIESAIIDVWTHRDLFPEASPRALLFSEACGVAWDDQSTEHADLLPLTERVERMGNGLASAALVDFPHYRSLVEFSFAKAGWDVSHFTLHRLRLDYPVLSTSLVMQFDLQSSP